MKYIRLSALALTGAVLLSLGACSPKEPDSTPVPEATGTPGAAVSASPTGTPEAQPTESINVITPPAETDAVVRPLETQSPVQTQPIQTQPIQTQPVQTPVPTAEPTETPAPDLTAADVYAKVSAVAGGNPMSDVGFALEEFYNLSASDLEDFVFYMPDMSATTEEIFIARVKSGKLDAVKSACQSRQQGMKEDAAIYPSAAAYVESSQIVTNGDWILFVVVAEPDSAVTAFNGCF